MADLKNDKGIVRGWVVCRIDKGDRIVIPMNYRTLYRLTRKEVYFIKKEVKLSLAGVDTEGVKEVQIYITKNMNRYINNIKHRKGKTGKFISVDELSQLIGLSRQVIWYRHNKHPLQFPIYKENGVWGVYEDEIGTIWANGKKLQDGRNGGVRNGKVIYRNAK